MLGTYHAEALLKALSDLYHLHERDALFVFVVARSCEVLNTQGGTFYTVDEEKETLTPQACRGVPLEALKEIPFKFKNGVAGWSALNRKAVALENAQTDDRFNRATDVMTGIKTKTLLCVPIIRQDKVVGLLELINRVDGIFRETDIQFVQYLCNQVAVAIENCELFQKTEELFAYSKSVINSLTGGFISTDANGLVTMCNASACRILGVAEVDVVGHSILTALPLYPAFAAILEVTQKRGIMAQREEITLERSDSTPLLIGYSTFLIQNDAKATLGAGIIFQDLSRFKNAPRS
jgi:PAS domain S-box-containing protein